MKNCSITVKMVVLIAIAIVTAPAVETRAYELKSSKENNVVIEITPEQLSPGKPAKFDVRMNTHSVPLTHDLVALATLKDDQGHKYRPLKWKGSPPGGHHRSGVLEFPAINEKTGSVTLYMRDIADVPERSFKWNIE